MNVRTQTYVQSKAYAMLVQKHTRMHAYVHVQTACVYTQTHCIHTESMQEHCLPKQGALGSANLLQLALLGE